VAFRTSFHRELCSPTRALRPLLSGSAYDPVGLGEIHFSGNAVLPDYAFSTPWTIFRGLSASIRKTSEDVCYATNSLQ
jgi:hypothetical protein